MIIITRYPSITTTTTYLLTSLNLTLPSTPMSDTKVGATLCRPGTILELATTTTTMCRTHVGATYCTLLWINMMIGGEEEKNVFKN